MGEDERGSRDAADLAGAGGDVLEGAPTAGEQREAAFAQAAQRAQEGVAGARADIEVASVCGMPDWSVNADARAVVARVGEGRQPGCGCLVERGQGVSAGGG